MYLQISNQGLVEAGALSLMGASVKEGEAIGKFGSGFKYALATLIRNGVEVRVFSGTREVKIETRPETFRDREFQVLWVDDIRTSITTETGKEWHIRDAVREIWSNARDEGHAQHAVRDVIIPYEGRTIVAIEVVGDVKRIIDNWELFFIDEVKEIHANRAGRIVKQSVPNYFRRGVWICEDRENVGLFSYDFADIELPESRRVHSHAVSYNLLDLMLKCGDEDYWDTILLNRNIKLAEWYALMNWGRSYTSSVGIAKLKEVFVAEWECYGNIDFKNKIEAGQHNVLWVDDTFCGIFKGLCLPSIFDIIDASEDFEVIPWPIGWEEKLDRPLAQLSAVGVNIGSFPIKLCRFHSAYDPKIAVAYRGTCYLTEKAFVTSPDMLMKALVEEWTHLQHGVADHTVAQQHVYLDLIVSLIGKMK